MIKVPRRYDLSPFTVVRLEGSWDRKCELCGERVEEGQPRLILNCFGENQWWHKKCSDLAYEIDYMSLPSKNGQCTYVRFDVWKAKVEKIVSLPPITGHEDPRSGVTKGETVCLECGSEVRRYKGPTGKKVPYCPVCCPVEDPSIDRGTGIHSAGHFFEDEGLQEGRSSKEWEKVLGSSEET